MTSGIELGDFSTNPELEPLAETGKNAVGASPGDSTFLARVQDWCSSNPAKQVAVTAPLWALLGLAIYALEGLGSGMPVDGDRFHGGTSQYADIQQTLVGAQPRQGDWSGETSAAYGGVVNQQIALVRVPNDPCRVGTSLRVADEQFAELLHVDFVTIWQWRGLVALAMAICLGAIVQVCNVILLGFTSVAIKLTAMTVGACTSPIVLAAYDFDAVYHWPHSTGRLVEQAIANYKDLSTRAAALVARIDAVPVTPGFPRAQSSTSLSEGPPDIDAILNGVPGTGSGDGLVTAPQTLSTFAWAPAPPSTLPSTRPPTRALNPVAGLPLTPSGSASTRAGVGRQAPPPAAANHEKDATMPAPGAPTDIVTAGAEPVTTTERRAS